MDISKVIVKKLDHHVEVGKVFVWGMLTFWCLHLVFEGNHLADMRAACRCNASLAPSQVEGDGDMRVGYDIGRISGPERKSK